VSFFKYLHVQWLTTEKVNKLYVNQVLQHFVIVKFLMQCLLTLSSIIPLPSL